MSEKRNPQTLPAGVPGSGRAPGGQWVKGAPPGPGRPKKARIKDAIARQYADKPTTLMYKRVAESLDLDVHEVPLFEEVQELQVWSFMMRSLGGSHEHARELLDRTDPKPSRSTIELKTTRGPVGAGGVSDEEAEEYYDKLPGPSNE
ncbi:MAG: hypothetical protein V3T08_09805 [Gemmatimonadota bacterium]